MSRLTLVAPLAGRVAVIDGFDSAEREAGPIEGAVARLGESPTRESNRRSSSTSITARTAAVLPNEVSVLEESLQRGISIGNLSSRSSGRSQAGFLKQLRPRLHRRALLYIKPSLAL